MKALGDSDWRVRRKAVNELLRGNGERSLLAIVRKMRTEHRDAGVLNSVLQMLVSMGAEALPSVIELTKDSDAELRMYAALVLGDPLGFRDSFAIAFINKFFQLLVVRLDSRSSGEVVIRQSGDCNAQQN